jgi:hypothetical protein
MRREDARDGISTQGVSVLGRQSKTLAQRLEPGQKFTYYIRVVLGHGVAQGRGPSGPRPKSAPASTRAKSTRVRTTSCRLLEFKPLTFQIIIFFRSIMKLRKI